LPLPTCTGIIRASPIRPLPLHMPRRIDPYSLRLFAATAREGSIARAAAIECIAASALSRRLSELENIFGTPLFVRSPRGITLTEAGQIAFSRAAQIDGELQSLVREVQAGSGQVCGTVRLFANASAVVGFLPERLKAFCVEYPLVEIALQERTSSAVVRACLDDLADVGVGAETNVSSGVESWHFANDPLMLVLPAGHELARRPGISFAEILAYPLVGVQQGGALDRLLRERAAALRIAMNVSVSVNSFDGVCRMVEAGLGVAVIPNSAASAYAGTGRFERRALDEPWSSRRELRLYAPRKSPRLAAVGALISALRMDEGIAICDAAPP
jgi:DNA-binding transcriptional LysR family regulator